MALNSEQNLALQHVAEGHNVLLMGSAGTGKSFLIKKIVDTVRKSGKNVYVTATTGIASSHYTDASTIHRWSGIGDGRLSIDDLKDVINNNKQYSDAKKRVLETDLLIIDECSMMSRKFFDSLNVICQLRNPALLFGGIQLLLAGDFKQLPPVPNILYGDEGEFCFTSRIFDKVFPHKIVLKTVIRQSEIPLIKAIDECAMGIVSPESIEFIKNLNRMLPPDTEKTTMLFSTNEQVDDFNRRSIIEHPGQIFEFNSVDSGEKRYLDRINVPKVLWLKIGAPVILMRNLTDKLVNGMQGVISGITKNGPVVKFSENELPIPKVKCTVFSPSKNMDVAVREQYPIKLAFAISIHKSQGMTLNRVEINCKGIFKPGQLAVAMGRCRSSKGLKVVNFTPSVCLPQPFEVQNFLSNLTSLPGLQDTSCCKALCSDQPQKMTVTVLEMLAADDNEYDSTADNDEFDSEFDNAIRRIDEILAENQSVELPEDLNIDVILQQIHEVHVVTPAQYNTNKILESIDKQKVKEFAQSEYAKLKCLLESQQKDAEQAKKVPASKQSEFYTNVYKYQTSVEFRMNCLSFFDQCPFTQEHLHICFNISNAIRKYLIGKQVEILAVSNRQISSRTLTNASMSRIRYVGGYCIAKVHYKYLQKKKSTMYKTDARNIALYEEAVVCVDILSELKVNEQYLLSNTCQPETLLDTERRQTSKNRSLTNISDSLFDFFKCLTEICLKLLTDEKLNQYGENIFEEVRSEILKNNFLQEKFTDVVKESSSTCLSQDTGSSCCEILYNKIVKQHLMVMVNQFRKDILESFNIEKKMSHRKQIQVSKGKAKSKAAVESSESITEEKSKKNLAKRKCSKRKHNVDEETEDDLLEIDSEISIRTIKTRNLKGKRTSTSKGKTAKSIDPEEDTQALSGANLDNPELCESTPDSPKPGTSGISQGKDTIGQTGGLIQESSQQTLDPEEGSDAEVDCIVCMKPKKYVKGVEEIEWIQCDSCDGWIHRSCAGLKHYLKWRKAMAEGAVFYCKQCK